MLLTLALAATGGGRRSPKRTLSMVGISRGCRDGDRLLDDNLPIHPDLGGLGGLE